MVKVKRRRELALYQEIKAERRVTKVQKSPDMTNSMRERAKENKEEKKPLNIRIRMFWEPVSIQFQWSGRGRNLVVL